MYTFSCLYTCLCLHVLDCWSVY